MKIVPLQNYILCELITEQEKPVTEKGVFFKKEEQPLYKVIDISQLTLDVNISVNDIIIINSTPTKVHVDNKDYYLVNQEHVMGICI